MKLFKKKPEPRPMLTLSWKDILDKPHDIKVFGNVDKIEGRDYYTCIIDDKKTFVISRFDGIWKTSAGIENNIAKILGELVEQYDKSSTLIEIITE